MLKIQRSAWGLVLLSAALQVVIFPLLGLYGLAWIAVAPLLVAILRARTPETLQLDGHRQARLLPATPWQGFVLGYVCGILWFAGTCYWIFDTMHRYGGLPIPAAVLALILFCMYVGLYHGMFGLLLALVAGSKPRRIKAPLASGASIRRALVAAPFLWVAVELARTRITAFPWELLGYSQTGNFALTRIATLTGVYGLSFEIVLVNSVFAAAFLAPREGAKQRRKWLLVAACAAAVILQSGAVAGASSGRGRSHRAFGAAEYSDSRWRDVDEGIFSGHAARLDRDEFASRRSAKADQHYDLIVWPESPSPFYTNDPLFRDAVSALARQSGTWVVAGAIGITPAMHSGGESSADLQLRRVGQSAGRVGWTLRQSASRALR